MPVQSLDSDALEQLHESVDEFFDGLDPSMYTVMWARTISLNKSGESYDSPVEILMMLRNSQSARTNDLLIGIKITGSHYGVGQRMYNFGIGDLITDVTGRSYKVVNANIGTGDLYWVLDLDRFNS